MNRDLTLGEADYLAQRFHETYESLAPFHGYETRPESRTHWPNVPPENKALMLDTMLHMFAIDDDDRLVVNYGIETHDGRTRTYSDDSRGSLSTPDR